MEYQKENLEGLNVTDLRKIAREAITENKTAILTLSRNDLIESILQGQIVREGGNGHNGNGNGNGNGHGSLGLEELIAKAVSPLLTPTLSIDEMREIVTDLVKEQIKEIPIPTRVIDESGVGKVVGMTHKEFEKILKVCLRRRAIMLVGPSGSGKTHLAEQIADAMNLPFYFIPVGPQTTKGDLLGFPTATGGTVRTMLREAYEFGGVFLLDEFDAGNAAVLTVLNAMTSNNQAAFPDGMVKKHKDFVLIAAANTFGRGANRQYVGRNQLDAATLDRFTTVNFDYDEDLELGLSTNKEWTLKIQAIRHRIFALKEQIVCSPRASFAGAEYLEDGWQEEEILDSLVFKGCSQEIKSRVMAGL
jgi:hypothetical protein